MANPAVIGAALFLVAAASSAVAAPPAYVGLDACTDCHQDSVAAWQGSHHDWALRPPDAASVLGDFNDATLDHYGITSRFFRDGDRFMVTTDGPDGETTYAVVFAVGVTPLQQYLVDTGDGRLQALDLAWDSVADRWFHLYPDEALPAGDGLHWSGPYKNWQARCAECHQTDFVKGYDPQTRGYDSTWSDLNVSCEACHGPGEAHVALYNGGSIDGFDGVDAQGLTMTFGDDPETNIQQCATCHSLRSPLGANSPLPGTPFADSYRLALLTPQNYFADGQILGEVYVYGSFLQSKMYAAGVQCSNCHDSHTGGLVTEGNTVCTQCHNPAGRDDFPTLPIGLYDSPDHHHHEEGTEGAQCVSCHMTDRTYMQVDPRRDHSFRVPRPDLSAETGAPDACTTCHDDQTAEWAADILRDWFPGGRMDTPHFATTIAAGRRDAAGHAADLMALALEPDMPAFLRASALEMLLPVSTPDIAIAAAPLLNDESPMVRAQAATLQRALPGAARAAALSESLSDPRQLVRIEAAKQLMDLTATDMAGLDPAALATALDEFRASLLARADAPETQMQIAGLSLTQRNLPAAKAALREALAMDRGMADAWGLLSRIQQAEQNPSGARATLAEAVAALPDDAFLAQAYGRMLLETGALRDAVAELERARDLSGNNPAVLIDLASARFASGDAEAAQATLAEAYGIAPTDPDVLTALSYFNAVMGENNAARRYLAELQAAAPGHPAIMQLQGMIGAD